MSTVSGENRLPTVVEVCLAEPQWWWLRRAGVTTPVQDNRTQQVGTSGCPGVGWEKDYPRIATHVVRKGASRNTLAFISASPDPS